MWPDSLSLPLRFFLRLSLSSASVRNSFIPSDIIFWTHHVEMHIGFVRDLGLWQWLSVGRVAELENLNTKLYTRLCCKEQSHISPGLTGSRMSDLSANTGCPVCDLNLAMKMIWCLTRNFLNALLNLIMQNMINSLCKLVPMQYPVCLLLEVSPNFSVSFSC